MSLCSAVIVAAGSGSRIASHELKQFLPIGGVEVLARTALTFQASYLINEIIFVVPEDRIDFCQEKIVNGYKLSKVKAVVPGGETRQHSVFNGLKAMDSKTDYVLIHDGVRPFVTEGNIKAIVDAVHLHKSCVLGVKAKDTIKISDSEQNIIAAPDRTTLWHMQTPQAFSYELLMKAYERAFAEGFIGTDDAMLVERLGFKTKIVEGSYSNIKITTNEDLAYSDFLLKQKRDL